MALPGQAHAARNGSAIGDEERAEREFIDSMDAMQEYVELQGKLQEQLKQGLMSLARARYSMGGRPVGQDQYDPTMVATTRCMVSPGSGSGSGPGSSAAGPSGQAAGKDAAGRRSFTVHHIAIPPPPACAAAADAGDGKANGGGGAGSSSAAAAAAAAAAGGSGRGAGASAGRTKQAAAGKAGSGKTGGKDDTAGLEDALMEELDLEEEEEEEWEEEAELREAQALLRRLRMEAEAAQRGGAAAGASGAGADGGKAEGAEGAEAEAKVGAGLQRKRGTRRAAAAPRDPLQWFGVMVPPALREAQSEFAAVVETCLQLATTAQRVRPVA